MARRTPLVLLTAALATALHAQVAVRPALPSPPSLAAPDSASLAFLALSALADSVVRRTGQVTSPVVLVRNAASPGIQEALEARLPFGPYRPTGLSAPAPAEHWVVEVGPFDTDGPGRVWVAVRIRRRGPRRTPYEPPDWSGYLWREALAAGLDRPGGLPWPTWGSLVVSPDSSVGVLLAPASHGWAVISTTLRAW